MNKNFSRIAAGLVAVSFSQFASPAALTALCTTFDPEDNEASSVKVVVEDNWKEALMFPQDEDALPLVLKLTCDGPKSMDEDFKCNARLDFSGSTAYNSFSFLRDSKNKMTFVAEVGFSDAEEPLDKTKYDCVEE